MQILVHEASTPKNEPIGQSNDHDAQDCKKEIANAGCTRNPVIKRNAFFRNALISLNQDIARPFDSVEHGAIPNEGFRNDFLARANLFHAKVIFLKTFVSLHQTVRGFDSSQDGASMILDAQMEKPDDGEAAARPFVGRLVFNKVTIDL